jgi:hypothetical protein
MKKDNTAKESAVARKRGHRKLTVGIDLGDRSIRYCVLDEQDEVLAEGPRRRTREALLRYLDRNHAAHWLGNGDAFSLDKSISGGSGP